MQISYNATRVKIWNLFFSPKMLTPKILKLKKLAPVRPGPNRNTGIHLSVSLPQSVSISGVEINLTLRAVTTYALCCNLAPSMWALKMCIFSNIVMK